MCRSLQRRNSRGYKTIADNTATPFTFRWTYSFVRTIYCVIVIIIITFPKRIKEFLYQFIRYKNEQFWRSSDTFLQIHSKQSRSLIIRSDSARAWSLWQLLLSSLSSQTLKLVLTQYLISESATITTAYTWFSNPETGTYATTKSVYLYRICTISIPFTQFCHFYISSLSLNLNSVYSGHRT